MSNTAPADFAQLIRLLLILPGLWASIPVAVAADYEVQQSADGSRVELISEQSPTSLYISRSRASTSSNPSLLVMCSEHPAVCSISIHALFRRANSPDHEQEQITLELRPARNDLPRRSYSSLILTAAVSSGQSLEAYSLIGITPADLKALRNHPLAILRIGTHTDVVFRPARLGLDRLAR